MKLLLLVIAVVILQGCAPAIRPCESKKLPMVWVDGNVTYWDITICYARK